MMVDDRGYHMISTSVVVCSGPAAAPHEPQCLSLPQGEVVECPECGERFVRHSGWSAVANAAWPKPE